MILANGWDVYACARFASLFFLFSPTMMSFMHVPVCVCRCVCICCSNMSAVGSRAPILNQPLNYLLCFKFRAMIKFHRFVRQNCYPIPARMNIFIWFEMTETHVIHENGKAMRGLENKKTHTQTQRRWTTKTRETKSRAQQKKECFKWTSSNEDNVLVVRYHFNACTLPAQITRILRQHPYTQYKAIKWRSDENGAKNKNESGNWRRSSREKIAKWSGWHKCWWLRAFTVEFQNRCHCGDVSLGRLCFPHYCFCSKTFE